jgi:hypothetical protein
MEVCHGNRPPAPRSHRVGRPTHWNGHLIIYRRGRKIRETEEAQAKLKRIEEVVHGFEAFIGKANISPLGICDESELPYRKQEIIQSCLAAIRISRDNPQHQAALAQGLLWVAQFQPGVGEPLRHPADVVAEKAPPLKPATSEEITDEEREETLKLVRELAGLSEDTDKEGRRKKFLEIVSQELQGLMKQIEAAR